MAKAQMALSRETLLIRFADWLTARKGLGDVTVKELVNTIKRYPELGTMPSEQAVEHHIIAMRKAGKSYSHICSTSLAFERYMEFIGKPMKLGRPKAPRSLIRGVLSEAEVVLLLAAAQNLREKAMLALLAYGGLRTKELCRLKVGDIDLGSQIVNIVSGKGNKDRLVNIAGACVGVLSAYLQERNGKINDSLFLTRWGKRQYQPQNLRKLVRKAAQRAGLSKRVYPYLLRHSLATNLLHRGANILAIKEQLGHAWVSTTMIYIHSAPQRMKMEYHMYAPSYL